MLAGEGANAYRSPVIDADPSPRQRKLIVAAALIDPDQQVLIQKRPKGKPLSGLWEFPGGKIEPYEGLAAGLVRELHEELGIIVQECDLEPFAFNIVVSEGDDLILLLYICRRWEGIPTPLVAEDLHWCATDQLANFDMPPADLLLVKRLCQAL